jgi:hypothetical protein
VIATFLGGTYPKLFPIAARGFVRGSEPFNSSGLLTGEIRPRIVPAVLGIEIPSIVALLIALVILWVIASIPVYIAGKIVTRGRASFGATMGATLGGILVYLVVLFGVSFFLSAVLGSSAYVWGVILGFVGSSLFSGRRSRRAGLGPLQSP